MEFLKLLVFVLVLANVDSLDCDCVEKILSKCEKPPAPTDMPIRTTIGQNDPPCTESVADIFFVLDESTSLNKKENFRKELDFVISVVDNLEIGPGKTQVGVMTFSDEPRLQVSLTKYSSKKALVQAINNLTWQTGDTYLDKALKLLRKEGLNPKYGSRRGVPQIAVIVTDGMSTDPPKTNRELATLHRMNYKLFAIGVGPERNKNELQLIAKDPSRVFEVDDLEALPQIRKSVTTRVCAQSISFGEFYQNEQEQKLKPKSRSFSLK